MAPRKSHPKGIDPAYPNRNFVDMTYVNHHDTQDGLMEEKYGPFNQFNNSTAPRERKASHFGHSIGQRAGKLRLSGTPGAHRIGKRK